MMIYLFSNRSGCAILHYGEYHYDTITKNVYCVNILGDYYQYNTNQIIPQVNGVIYGKQKNEVFCGVLNTKDGADRYIGDIILSKILENI